MILTEEEAKEKWCPFVRLSVLVDNEQTPAHNRAFDFDNNRGVPNNKHTRCIASDCMAWRWAETNVKDENALDNFGNKPGTRLDRRTYGFCGLAGRLE